MAYQEYLRNNNSDDSLNYLFKVRKKYLDILL
jgi:hypothetical protein